ncbi:MAG: sugar phosphate nucleotidyltransferase, partial [Chloroflexota bacterium]|nr:sugar phosphate nucleotidyltransferase [Chloroflexota bacterium]
MLPILGKPIVERVMNALCEGGISDFILVVNPKDEEILEHFAERVRFAFQGEPLGMAHALRCAAHLIEGDFLLAACDSLVSPAHVAELVRCQSREDVSAALSLRRVDRLEISRLSAVGLKEDLVTRIVEKPSPDETPSGIASLPLYVLPSTILNYLDEVPLSPRGEYELQDAIQMLIEREGGVRGVFTTWRLDLTRPEDLLAINRYYLAQGLDAEVVPSALGVDTEVIPPVRIEEGVSMGKNCVIGPYVYLESGSRLGSGVRVEEAVVL